MTLSTQAAVAAPKAEVRGELPDDLRERIENAVGETDDAPDNRFQARRRARAAAEDATAVLRSEGYYASTVTPDITEADPALPYIDVQPGPRFLIADPAVEWTEPPPEAGAAAAAREAIELEPGEPGRAADVVAAEGRIVAVLTRQGYADASAGARRVVVDHADNTLTPTYRIASGPLVRLDGVTLRTQGPTNPQWVAGLAPWREGEVYDPEDVAELERRLTETGVYDSVTVALSPPSETNAEGLRPIVVGLRDQPARVLEAGVGWSTSEGVGVDAAWTWRNRFGRADTLRFDLRLAEIDSRIGATLSLPHWRRPGRTLKLSAAVVDEETDAYNRRGLLASADLTQRFGPTSFYSYGAALEAGQYEDITFDSLGNPVPRERTLYIATLRGSATLDRSNDPLDPTQGWRASLDLQPTLVGGDTSLAFLRAAGQVSAYLPLDEQGDTVVAGRIRAGSIAGADGVGDVPSDRRFFAGGGGSIRGYEFQSVGPRLPDGTPQGGLSLIETSLEVRRRIGERWGAVAFIDGGTVGESSFAGFDGVQWAVGAGVRYHLPFGPIRADIAIPLDKREGDAAFQLYISIGQAF
ncbi:autotransporter assembly complex family protein [Peiella sedimenti]|uniref:autotransporter assembly complex protein TamA n=1 Tax=Peiella sedimenti TaxID=3061083 RepID=UPI003137D2F2